MSTIEIVAVVFAIAIVGFLVFSIGFDRGFAEGIEEGRDLERRGK